jgi:hypothetical protein
VADLRVLAGVAALDRDRRWPAFSCTYSDDDSNRKPFGSAGASVCAPAGASMRHRRAANAIMIRRLERVIVL